VWSRGRLGQGVLQTVHGRRVLSAVIVETRKPRDFIDVTTRVQSVVETASVADGICVVYSPHTAADITINDNADPDVGAYLLKAYTDLLGDEARFRASARCTFN